MLAQGNGTATAKKIFEQVRDQGIYVRYFDAPRLENALRITVGANEEIEKLLKALRIFVA